MKITRNPTPLEQGDSMSYNVVFEGIEQVSNSIERNLRNFAEQIKKEITEQIHDEVVAKVKDQLVAEIIAGINKDAITNMATITLARSIGEEVAKGLIEK